MQSLDQTLDTITGQLGIASASLTVRVDGVERYHRTVGVAPRV